MKSMSNIILYTTIFFISSCSLFFPVVKVEVPAGYEGWCHIVPVYDTVKFSFAKNDGRYVADTNGIIYVPFDLIDSPNDFMVKIYENDKEITSQAKYQGRSENSYSWDSMKYISLQFYLPELDKRDIPENDQYWRDKHYECKKQDKFDSLLKNGKVIYHWK